MFVKQLVYILTGIVAFGVSQIRESATDVSLTGGNTQPTSLDDYTYTAVSLTPLFLSDAAYPFY